MPAPKRPNTTAATAAVVARGDRTAADRLTRHGWTVIDPDTTAQIRAKMTIAQPDGSCQHSQPACDHCLAVITLTLAAAYFTPDGRT